MRMLTCNPIEGLLPVKGRGMNGNSFYDYDIEEFTEKIYNWYLDALKNFGFSFEAAAPESGEAAEETAAEYQEAAADLVKTAAAVVVGFFGFYLTFAIFGI